MHEASTHEASTHEAFTHEAFTHEAFTREGDSDGTAAGKDYRAGLPTRELIFEVRRLLVTQRHAARLICRYLADLADRIRARQDAELGVYVDELHAARCCFQLGVRDTRERVRIGRALRQLPQIERAFIDGELSYSRVREVTRVDRPLRAEWATSKTVRVTFELGADAWALLERALVGARRLATDKLTDGEALEAVARDALSRQNQPADESDPRCSVVSSSDVAQRTRSSLPAKRATTQGGFATGKAWIGGSHVDEMIETLLEPCNWQRLATRQKRVLRTPTTVATGGSVRSVDSEYEGRVIELRKWDYSRAFGLLIPGGNIDALRRRRDQRPRNGMRHRRAGKQQLPAPRSSFKAKREERDGVVEHGKRTHGAPQEPARPCRVRRAARRYRGTKQNEVKRDVRRGVIAARSTEEAGIAARATLWREGAVEPRNCLEER